MTNTTAPAPALAPVAGFYIGDYANILTALEAMVERGNEDAPRWGELANAVRRQIEYELEVNRL